MSILSNVLGGLGKGVSSTGNGSNGYEEKRQINTLDYKGPLKANKIVLSDDNQFEYDGSGTIASRDANTDQTLLDVPANIQSNDIFVLPFILENGTSNSTCVNFDLILTIPNT